MQTCSHTIFEIEIMFQSFYNRQNYFKEKHIMNRYWVSWWTCINHDNDNLPVRIWITGEATDYQMSRDRVKWSICSMIDAESVEVLWDWVSKNYPDFEERFCKLEANNAKPNDRFPDFDESTTGKLTRDMVDAVEAYIINNEHDFVYVDELDQHEDSSEQDSDEVLANEWWDDKEGRLSNIPYQDWLVSRLTLARSVIDKNVHLIYPASFSMYEKDTEGANSFLEFVKEIKKVNIYE